MLLKTSLAFIAGVNDSAWIVHIAITGGTNISTHSPEFISYCHTVSTEIDLSLISVMGKNSS